MIRRHPFHALMLLVLLAGWILLSFYNLLVDDDLVFLRLLHENGILEATRNQYDTWNTRWMSFLWLHLWMQFWSPDSSLLTYHLFTLTALAGASFRCLRALQSLNRVRQGSIGDTLFMSGLMTFSIVIASYHIGDTWFWVNTSTMYGWNLILIVWACSIVLMPYKSGKLNFPALVLCGLYTGGSSEPAVASLLVLLIASLLIGKLSPGQRWPILAFLLPMCGAFLVAYMGQGHIKREEALPDTDLFRFTGLSTLYFIRISVIDSPIRLLMILALLWPLRKPKTDKEKHSSTTFLLPTLIWLTTIAIHAVLIVYIMGDYGPPRALSFIGLTAVLCLVWVISIIDWNWIVNLGKFGIYPVIIFLCWTIVKQAQLIPAYSNYVLLVNNAERQLKQEEIPDSGLLHRITFTD